jgi:rSAM/selenodomain-associated transferase 1
MNPAVAVMAKVPGAAPVKSRLHGPLTAEQATLLYRCFLLDRLDGLCAVPGIDRVVAFTPAAERDTMGALAPPGFRLVPQTGSDLGERLANVLGGLLAEGHPGALAVDSDSPTLPMAYVSEAVRLVAEDAADLVLGPSDDGGYYLVGLRAPQPALFQDVPWSTAAVLRVTLAKARALGLRTHLLPPWFDVDTEADLRRLRREMPADGGVAARTRAFLTALYR